MKLGTTCGACSAEKARAAEDFINTMSNWIPRGNNDDKPNRKAVERSAKLEFGVVDPPVHSELHEIILLGLRTEKSQSLPNLKKRCTALASMKGSRFSL